jgi:hypothetical protein
MIGILTSNGWLSAMKLALMVLCVGAVAFLVRVLAALVLEAKSTAPRAMRAYHARFHPLGKRGELIEMKPHAVTHRFSARTGQRIALSLLVILSLSWIGPVHSILKF